MLVDTNVVLDALASREPWRESAEKIFLMAANRLLDMYITASSATDIYYLVRKYLHSTQQAKQTMGKLYSFAGILPVTETECVDALGSPMEDYEDAVIERVAARAQMDYIVTRNVKDFQPGMTKVLLPEDLVNLINT